MRQKSKNIVIQIEKDKILFPNGYFFKQSIVNISQKIESEAIAEVNLSTFPPSLVYNGNEIVFVEQENKLEIEQFAKQNKIPILNRFDI